MPVERLPKSVWEGTFKIFGVELRCSILDDGRRVIHSEDIEKLFSVMASEDLNTDLEENNEFFKWVNGG